jgi:hypothetical protein
MRAENESYQPFTPVGPMTDGQVVALLTAGAAVIGAIGLFIRHTAGERSESKGGKPGHDDGFSYLQAGDMRELMVVLKQLRDNMEPMRHLPELVQLMHSEIAGVRGDVRDLDDRTAAKLDALAFAARNPDRARTA